MKSPFEGLGASLPCQCGPEYEEGCVCPRVERTMRWYRDGEGEGRRPLLPEERAWCFAEIRRVETADMIADDASDGDLAGGVLCAWADFARDKGLR